MKEILHHSVDGLFHYNPIWFTVFCILPILTTRVSCGCVIIQYGGRLAEDEGLL